MARARVQPHLGKEMEGDKDILDLLYFDKANPNPDYRNPPERRDMEMDNEENKEGVKAAEEKDAEQAVDQMKGTTADPDESPSSPGPQDNNRPGSVMPIDSIRIGNRFRKDLGDLLDLMESIEDVGLLHPVVVTPDGKLVAGHRRLSACMELGHTEIPVRIVNIENLVQAEYDENEMRMNLSPGEAVKLSEFLRPKEEEKAKERKRKASQIGGKIAGRNRPKGQDGGNLPPTSKGKTRDIVAAAAGYSATSLRNAKAVIEAAEKDPARYAHLFKKMEETRKIDSAYRELKKLQGEDPTTGEEPAPQTQKKTTKKASTVSEQPPSPPDDSEESLSGMDEDEHGYSGTRKPKFSDAPIPVKSELIVVNTPWETGKLFSAMSREDLCDLPVPAMAADNCILWLSAPISHIADAYTVLARWGFEPKDILSVITREPGEWLMYKREHFIMAVKGNPEINKEKQSPANVSVRTDEMPEEAALRAVQQHFTEKSRIEVFPESQHEGWQPWPFVPSAVAKRELEAVEVPEQESLKKADPDTGSTEGSLSGLAALADTDAQTLFPQEAEGRSAAENMAI